MVASWAWAIRLQCCVFWAKMLSLSGCSMIPRLWGESSCVGGMLSLPQQVELGHRVEGGRWEPHSLSPFPGFYHPPVMVSAPNGPCSPDWPPCCKITLASQPTWGEATWATFWPHPACAAITVVLSWLLAGGLSFWLQIPLAPTHSQAWSWPPSAS